MTANYQHLYDVLPVKYIVQGLSLIQKPDFHWSENIFNYRHSHWILMCNFWDFYKYETLDKVYMRVNVRFYLYIACPSYIRRYQVQSPLLGAVTYLWIKQSCSRLHHLNFIHSCESFTRYLHGLGTNVNTSVHILSSYLIWRG